MRVELIERAKEGDREAFAEIAALKIDGLYAAARLMLRDADLAEDVVQNTLIRCWRQLPKLRDTASFDGWLYRILSHAALDESRRRTRFAANVQNRGAEPSIADASHLIADREEMQRAFAKLSLEHRAVVVLHHYADLSLPDVAKALGIPL